MEAYRSGLGVFDNSPNHIYYSSLRPEMSSLLPAAALKILDVGCGSGVFAHSLKQLQPAREIWGIEINPSVGNEAAKVLDRVLIGDISTLLDQLPQNYFDAVYFNDVLEHLPDPYTILRRIKQNMKEDGHILVSLPNVRYIRNFFNFIVRKDWAYTDHGILDRTHLRFFTLKSAFHMFESMGYKVEKFQGIESTKKWYMRPLNWLCLGYFEDTFHLQYIFKVRIS